MGRRLVVWSVVACALVAAAASAWGRTLVAKRPAPGDAAKWRAEERAQRWINAPVKDSPSKRRILESKATKFPQALGSRRQDVLRLCGIRVEFASVPDPAKISGAGGRFDLSDQRATGFIDPAPHDRTYFSKHMESLANYMSAMSYGALKVEWEVFPLETEGAYVLPDAGLYNPGGQVGSWTDQSLKAFFTDAVLAADQDEDLKFSDFDAVVIFHAGSDWQNDIAGDSPYDIPSFFLTLPDSDSIAVDGGTWFIKDGSVVPETSSQDGYINGINGVLAHEVGHQLGLPDLYDTQYGLSAVGYWDLMDYGSGVGVVLADPNTDELYYVTGILPGSLSAWSKAFMGWVVPDTAQHGWTYSLAATELQAGGSPNREAVVVPLNSYEYYIIENRQCDLDGDSTGIVLSDPGPDSTGVIMGPVNQNREFNYEYDWPLPGGGLLVWHVDDVMVDFGLPYDIVNAFWPRRGVRLAEADGIPDLGNYNSFYFLGSPWDPFFKGNNDRFADDTYPNTRSNTGCHSHITIDGIDESGLEMSFKVSYGWRDYPRPLALGDSLRFGVPSLLVADLDGDGAEEVAASLKRAEYKYDTLGVAYVEYYRSEIYAFDYAEGPARAMAGWPRALHGSHPREITGADLDGDGAVEIVVCDETGRLYAYEGNGSAYFESSDTLGAFLEVEGALNGAAVAHDLDGDGSEEIVAGTGSGLLVIEGSGPARLSSRTAALDRGVSQAVVLDSLPASPGAKLICYSAGALLVRSASGEPLDSLPVGCRAEPGEVFLAAGDLDRRADGRPEVVVAEREGRVWAVDLDGRLLPGWGVKMCDRVAGPPSLADIDSDGYLEVILTDGGSKTRVFTRTGAQADGWPQPWTGCGLPDWDYDFYIADTTIAVPSSVVGDFGCLGGLGIFQGSLFECIVGWDGDGQAWPGLPATLGGGCSSIALGDPDADGVTDMIAGGGDGYLYRFSHCDGGEQALPSPWPCAYFGRQRNCVYPDHLLPPAPEPGTRLLVRGSFHAYPNPATQPVVTFVFDTETGGDATIEIFDLAGAVVRSEAFVAAGQPRPMDISGLASGLYLCRLELVGEHGKASEFFKLAVKR